MNRNTIIGTILTVALLIAMPASAEESLVQIVADGCRTEIDRYCKDVTHGEGRILACLYSHQDKLSGRCEYALYDAASQLERAVNALVYLVNECEDDLDQFCGAVEAGEGRLLECIENNEKRISSRCKEALNEVGIKQ